MMLGKGEVHPNWGVEDDAKVYLRKSMFDDFEIATFVGFSSPKKDDASTFSQHLDTTIDVSQTKFDLPQGVVFQRKSSAQFIDCPLSFESLVSALVSTNSAQKQNGELRRPFPSAGAIYPIEVLVSLYLEDQPEYMPHGVYHHQPYSNSLSLIARPSQEVLLAAVCGSERDKFSCHTTVLFYALNLGKCLQKYKHRGLLFAMMDVGAIYQTITMQVEKLSGKSRVWGGFAPNQLSSILQLDQSIFPIVACHLIGR